MTAPAQDSPPAKSQAGPAVNLISRYPFTTGAIVYLIISGIRFMWIKDFSEWDKVFVLAARQLRVGNDIYTLLPAQNNHLFSYPPFSALFALPFSFGNWHIGRFVFYLVNVVSIVILWRGSWIISGGEKLEGNPRTPWREYLICILGLACAMRFVEDNLEHQQIDVIIGAILIGGCFYWQRGRDWLAATLWGLASAFKGPPGIFAIYLVWRGRWKQAIWMTLLALVLNLAPDLVHRAPHGVWLSEWNSEILGSVKDGEAGWKFSGVELNQAIAGAVGRYCNTSWTIEDGKFRVLTNVPHLPARPVKLLLYGIELTMLVLTALVMGAPLRRRASDPGSAAPPLTSHRAALECSAVLLLMLMLSPMSSKPHFCVLLLPAFVVARSALTKRDSVSWTAIAICIIAVVILDRNFIGSAHGDLMMWMGSVMWGSIALWLACVVGLFRMGDKGFEPLTSTV